MGEGTHPRTAERAQRMDAARTAWSAAPNALADRRESSAQAHERLLRRAPAQSLPRRCRQAEHAAPARAFLGARALQAERPAQPLRAVRARDLGLLDALGMAGWRRRRHPRRLRRTSADPGRP